jgi:hypothetical protein
MTSFSFRSLSLIIFSLLISHESASAKNSLFLNERKELALLQCLRENYSKLGIDLYSHDYSALHEKYINLKKHRTVEGDLLAIAFVEKHTSDYYKENISIKNENNKPPPFTLIFARCMDFYKSKKLDTFLRNNKP